MPVLVFVLVLPLLLLLLFLFLFRGLCLAPVFELVFERDLVPDSDVSFVIGVLLFQHVGEERLDRFGPEMSLAPDPPAPDSVRVSRQHRLAETLVAAERDVTLVAHAISGAGAHRALALLEHFLGYFSPPFRRVDVAVHIFI